MRTSPPEGDGDDGDGDGEEEEKAEEQEGEGAGGDERRRDEKGPRRPRRRPRPAALRLAVLNFPHNPTGCTLASAALLERALALCLDKGALHVLSDEMYRGLQRSGGGGCGCGCSSRDGDGDGDGDDDRGGKEASPRSLPTAAALAASRPAFAAEGRRERVVSLGGLSKWGGAPGLRVGWLATKDRALLGSVGSLRDHTTICNSAPSEALALAAMGSPGAAERLRARGRAIVDGNVAAARSFFERSNADFFEFYAPEASTTCLPRLRTESAGMSVEELCRRAREEAGVLLLPWSAFGGFGGGALGKKGPPGPPAWIEGRFRLGLGRRDLPAALEALGKLLEKVRGEGKGPLL